MLALRSEQEQTAEKRPMTPAKKAKTLEPVLKPLGLEFPPKAQIIRPRKKLPSSMPDFALWNGDVEAFLKVLLREPIFDLIVSSPPYNIGKSYEKRSELHGTTLSELDKADRSGSC